MSEPLVTVIGWSGRADAESAGKEAAERAVAQLTAAHQPRLAMMFGSSWFEQPALLQGARAVLGDVPLAGESTAGEITPEGPVSHTCVVVLLAGSALVFSIGTGESVERNPREAGQQAAYSALQGFPGSRRTGLLLFGDGLTTGNADMIRGIQEALGTSFLIAGGMAGDDLRFTKTYQYANDRILSGSVVGILFGDAIKMGVGLEHGFAPISKPRQITRSRANILYELDRQPAAAVYEEYFGPELMQRMRHEGLTRQAIAYPLGIQGESMNRWLLRNVLNFGEDGSLACTGEIPEGSWLQLMIGSRELALEAAQQAGQQAVRSLNRTACALVFDSAMRKTLLGSQHAAVEIAQIREAVGSPVPLAGCYTYSEGAPSGPTPTPTAGKTVLQTGSVLVVALGT